MNWIFGKIARRMTSELALLIPVTLGSTPDPSADLNHYVWYADYEPGTHRATIGITHVDSVGKLELIRTQLTTALAGICLSRSHMADLVHAGLPAARLWYVNPAHDGVIAPKKLHIGLTTRLYTPDPCKREWMLRELAAHIDPADFSFTIMGSGWEAIVDVLRRRQFIVTYYREFSQERYQALMPTLDYYLYLGWDEGSMGFLDALHAGVETIATPQGFHLDIQDGLTHRITDTQSLVSVFHQIAQGKRRRSESVSELTWKHYADRHLAIWKHLLSVGPIQTEHPAQHAVGSGHGTEIVPNVASGQRFLADLAEIDRTRATLKARYEGVEG